MIQNSSVQYSFAYDSTGKVVHVSEVYSPNGWLAPYSCIGCGSELIPKLGDIKAHHFSHKHLNCSYESYIHKLAKEHFKIGFDHARLSRIPYKLNVVQKIRCDIESCNNRQCDTFVDLAQIFDTIYIEKGFDGFVMDILLLDSRSDRKLGIEIYHTHKCSDEKKASGIPIIEIPVYSETDALELSSSPELSISRYSSYNFKQTSIRKVPRYTCLDCPGIDLFVLYSSGKPFIFEGYRGEVLKGRPLLTLEFDSSDYLTYHPGHSFFEGICQALEKGLPVNWRPSENRIWVNLYNWLDSQGAKGIERRKLIKTKLPKNRSYYFI